MISKINTPAVVSQIAANKPRSIGVPLPTPNSARLHLLQCCPTTVLRRANFHGGGVADYHYVCKIFLIINMERIVTMGTSRKPSFSSHRQSRVFLGATRLGSPVQLSGIKTGIRLFKELFSFCCAAGVWRPPRLAASLLERSRPRNGSADFLTCLGGRTTIGRCVSIQRRFLGSVRRGCRSFIGTGGTLLTRPNCFPTNGVHVRLRSWVRRSRRTKRSG